MYKLFTTTMLDSDRGDQHYIEEHGNTGQQFKNHKELLRMLTKDGHKILWPIRESDIPAMDSESNTIVGYEVEEKPEDYTNGEFKSEDYQCYTSFILWTEKQLYNI